LFISTTDGQGIPKRLTRFVLAFIVK